MPDPILEKWLDKVARVHMSQSVYPGFRHLPIYIGEASSYLRATTCW